MRKKPLYPKPLPKPPATIHRTVIHRLAWKMIVFILFIARALPGNERKEPHVQSGLLLGQAHDYTDISQRDTRGIAAYLPRDGSTESKDENTGRLR